MAHYTELGREDIQKLLDPYGLSEFKQYKLLTGGSENTNYLVHTGEGKYVLSICEQKSARETEELALLLEHLAKHGFETSRVIRTTKKQAISFWKGKPLMLKVFLEGEIIEDLSLDLLESIGTSLGQLHQIPAPDYLPKSLNYGIEQFGDVGLYALDSSFDKWLKEISTYMAPFLALDLPKSLIHSDVFFSNVIIDSKRQSACIMDFEEATFYYRVFDIGMTIIGLCSGQGKVELDKAKVLIKGYLAEVDLSIVERKSLQAFTVYAAAAMAFWRHRNFNFTNPDPAMKDHYLELKNLADYVRLLPEDSFI